MVSKKKTTGRWLAGHLKMNISATAQTLRQGLIEHKTSLEMMYKSGPEQAQSLMQSNVGLTLPDYSMNPAPLCRIA